MTKNLILKCYLRRISIVYKTPTLVTTNLENLPGYKLSENFSYYQNIFYYRGYPTIYVIHV